jgi:hypothetical protein
VADHGVERGGVGRDVARRLGRHQPARRQARKGGAETAERFLVHVGHNDSGGEAGIGGVVEGLRGELGALDVELAGLDAVDEPVDGALGDDDCDLGGQRVADALANLAVLGVAAAERGDAVGEPGQAALDLAHLHALHASVALHNIVGGNGHL